MREVGDRFQNMYFAAKGGNWALAAYMSKYMNGSMGPASVTKPDEYKTWKNFYDNTFAPVTKAIQARDFKAFDTAYTSTIKACNGCHAGMGYGFIQLEPISKSPEEDDDAGELDKTEEVLGVELPADEDATLPLYPGEEALDEPASHIAAYTKSY